MVTTVACVWAQSHVYIKAIYYIYELPNIVVVRINVPLSQGHSREMKVTVPLKDRLV